MSSFRTPKGSEGPVMFKRNNTYYILTGTGCCACIGGSDMPMGTVKKFLADKGFGFIKPKDGGEQIFVHRKVHGDGTDRSAYLEEGDEVEYEVEYDDRKGKYAATSCTGFKTGGGGGGGSGWGGGGGGW